MFLFVFQLIAEMIAYGIACRMSGYGEGADHQPLAALLIQESCCTG